MNIATTPCGRSRRELLWEMGGGFVSTALTFLLAGDGFFGPLAAAEPNRSASPLVPRPPHFAGKAKSCIFVFMYGGPSQVDTWDPKPELTRRHGQPIPNLESDPLLKVRNPGTLLGSVRTFRKCGKSGIDVSDIYPRLGRCVDDMAILRSTYADSFAPGPWLLHVPT